MSVCVSLAAVSVAHAQDVEAGRKKAEACIACHGADGNSKSPQIPILAGQSARYIYVEIKDIKEGRRSEPQTEPFVKNLSREDMFDIAAFFSAQKPRSPDYNADPAKIARGRAKAEETLCTMCHLGGFKGQNEVPRVAGQHPAYVIKQLQDFKHARRTNDGGNMHAVAKTLSDQDIDDLADFLSTLD
ncbi:MAG: c-type cytochrome [Gemmatimonadota bacterium]